MTLPATLLKVRLDEPLRAETVGRIQDNVGTLLNQVAAVPVLQANTIVGVEFGSAAHPSLTQDIPHGLGRNWTNFAITDQDQPANFYRSSVANRDKFLTLTADGAVTINVMVW